MATILTFSPHADPRRTPPPADTHAEVIVFPRNDLRALARLTDGGETHAIEVRGDKEPD